MNEKLILYSLFGVVSLAIVLLMLSTLKYVFIDRDRIKTYKTSFIVIPKTLMWASILPTIGCDLIMMSIIFEILPSVKHDSKLPEVIGFSIFAILGIILWMVVLNWRIEFKNDLLVYTDIFGMKHKYKCKDLYYKHTLYGMRVYKNGRYKFFVSLTIDSSILILDKLMSYYEKTDRLK